MARVQRARAEHALQGLADEALLGASSTRRFAEVDRPGTAIVLRHR